MAVSVPTKEQSLKALLNLFATLIIVVPGIWLVLKPLVAKSLAEETKQIVKREIKPLNSAFEILMEDMIASLKTEISDMEFKRDQSRQGRGEWTRDDNRKLQRLNDELRRNEAVLEALRSGGQR